jgi:hypothetical protein
MIIVDVVDKCADITLGAHATVTTVRARLHQEFVTLCGVSSEISHSTSREKASFTLGGLLLIRDKVFGLTAGHPLWVHCPTQSLSRSEDWDNLDDGSSTDDNDTSDSFFVIMESNTGNGSEASSQKETSDSIGPSYEDSVEIVGETGYGAINNDCSPNMEENSNWTAIGSFTYPPASGTGGICLDNGGEGRTASSIQSDWALFRIPDRDLWLGNFFQKPGELSRTLIENTASDQEIVVGQAYVVAGVSGTQRGFMSQCSVSLNLDNHKLKVRRITLERALGMALDSSSVSTRMFSR